MELNLESNVNAMLNLMDSLSNQLDEITPENFEEKFQAALETMMVIQKIKEDLIKVHGADYLQKNIPEVCKKAKLIEEKYDNIIVEFKNAVKKLEKEILNLNSKKKIINYLR